MGALLVIPSIYVPTVIVTVCSGTNSETLFPGASPDLKSQSFFEIGKLNQFGAKRNQNV